MTMACLLQTTLTNQQIRVTIDEEKALCRGTGILLCFPEADQEKLHPSEYMSSLISKVGRLSQQPEKIRELNFEGIPFDLGLPAHAPARFLQVASSPPLQTVESSFEGGDDFTHSENGLLTNIQSGQSKVYICDVEADVDETASDTNDISIITP